MITLQAIRLDAYDRFQYRIDFHEDALVTSDAGEAAAKLAVLGVERPSRLLAHCRQWGSVEIHNLGPALASYEWATDGDNAELQRRFLLMEVERIVRDARKSGRTLRTGEHAALLLNAYPACGFSIGRIIDELTLVATRDRVPVEIGRPA